MDMMKRCFTILVIAMLFPASLYAYRMPEYSIAEADWSRPAEDVFADYSEQRESIVSGVSVSRLENHRRCHNCQLSRKEKAIYKDYLANKVPYEFWKYVVDLKGDLISMTKGDVGARQEADLMAKMIIQKLYELSNEYRIAGSALIQNALVNIGTKDKGFCYHYADALRKMLWQHKWEHFDFHWGAAYDKTILENNGLVITAKGRSFETGIVVDPWRTASRPYWNAVKGDRYPWKELHDVQIASD